MVEKESNDFDQNLDLTQKIVSIISSAGAILSGVLSVVSYLGYLAIPFKYFALVFCILVALYLALNTESICVSKNKTKFLVYSNIFVVVLLAILFMANWGTDFKTKVEIDFDGKAYIDENIKGTATNIPDGYQLWILVYPKTAQKYYPQHDSIEIQDGKWSIPIRIGNENNVGEKFDIVAVLADQNANEKFELYKGYCDTGSCPGMADIPEGAEICDSIEITRI